jgi:hypothetical protein
MKPNPEKPTLSLLVKLGSIAVHAEELLSPKGHPVDKIALQSLLTDPEVKQWLKDMGAFMPVKR